MADFPKKQQQCLIPKYLLDYLGQLDENHPDPSAEWGGQGTEYTAGTGIVIENDEISVDTETIPTVSDLSTVAFSGSYLNLSDTPDLSVYQLEENAFKVLDFTSYSGAQTSQELWDALEDTWPRVIVKYYGNYFVPETDSLPYLSEYRLTCVHATHNLDIQTQKETYEISVNNLLINEYNAFQEMPITVTNDYDDLVNKPTIPTVPTNVSAFTNDADYATETYVDTTAANSFKVLDFTQFFGQPALFAELEEAWPKVFILYHGYMYMPMTFEEVEPSYTFIHVDGQYNPIDPQNPANDINLNRIQINRYYVMQYNCIISNDYNDLLNRPTIPAAVSGTNDGTNWTSLTIGTNTYNIPQGGGSSYTAGTGIDIINDVISIDNTVALKTDIPTVPTNISAFNNDSGYITGINSTDVITALGYTPGTSNFSGSYTDLTDKPTIPTATSQLTNDSGFITSSALPTNYVTTDTTQQITGEKTFVGEKRVKFKQGTSTDKLGFTCYDRNNREKAYLEYNPTNNGLYLGRYGSYGVNELGFKSQVQSNTSITHNLLVPNVTLTTSRTDYIPISVNGTRADSTGDITISIPTVPTNVSAFTNDAGYITGITDTMINTALGYTAADASDVPSTATSTSTSTSTSTVTPTTVTLTFTYSDNTTENVTLMTDASVATTTTTTTTTTLS